MSDDRIEINLADLDNFIRTLQDFNNQLETNWARLDSRWQTADQSWRDKKKQQFSDAVGWEDVRKTMKSYIQASQNYLGFLKKPT